MTTTIEPETWRFGRAGEEPLERLSDVELERELTIAAQSTRRQSRYDALLAERRRRRRHPNRA